jgi:hypothetical protein
MLKEVVDFINAFQILFRHFNLIFVQCTSILDLVEITNQTIKAVVQICAYCWSFLLRLICTVRTLNCYRLNRQSRPSNTVKQWYKSGHSVGCFFFPDMFRQMVATLKGSGCLISYSVMLCVWAYTCYDPSRVTNCCGISTFHNNCPHETGPNTYTPIHRALLSSL